MTEETQDVEQITSLERNLPPHLLASTIRFYRSRIALGSMPIELGGGKYCHSYDPKDFKAYLARFTTHDQAKITEGIDLMKKTNHKTTKLIADLLEQMPTNEVNQLLQSLTEE